MEKKDRTALEWKDSQWGRERERREVGWDRETRWSLKEKGDQFLVCMGAKGPPNLGCFTFRLGGWPHRDGPSSWSPTLAGSDKKKGTWRCRGKVVGSRMWVL